LKEVKQNTNTKMTPVVLLTNLGQDVIIKEGFELGAEGYLIKASLTPSQVVQEVKNVLTKKSAPQTPPAQ
jgi:PleD family two-component response regulator